MNPLDNPKSYDSFLLGGVPSPGKATFSFPERDHGWEKQKSNGKDGASTSLKGSDLVEFVVELFLWRDENVDHYARWESWKKLLDASVKTGDKKALDIYHPQLDDIGVRSVVLKKRTGRQPDGKGGATVKLTFLEYAPAKTNKGKPAGSKAPGGGADKVGDKPDPNAGYKAQLEKQIEIRRAQRAGDHSKDDQI